MSRRMLALAPLVALLVAGPALAEPDEVVSRYESKPDYGRSGWYVGIGGGAGFDFFLKAIENATLGEVTVGSGGSFNARGGYRPTSWFAFEAMYEGIYGMNVDLLGIEVANLTLHSVVPNFKFLLPLWRFQPYLAIGPGAQYGDFDANEFITGPGLGSLVDTNRWDFVLRIGVGLDAYITENWLVNLEIAPWVRFADWGSIPSEFTDNVSLTFSGGVQYRF
jgi:opacity protein-like surface antigen